MDAARMSEPLPPELDAALRASAARRGRFGTPTYFFDETGSTNDVAAALAEQGSPDGTAVIALSQTAGRGRLGRTWFSPPGAGLYLSIICRDRAAAPYLTLAGGVAAADGIRRATGLPVDIKWPNDIVVAQEGGAAHRKLAGILAEGSSGPDGVQHVVLGFGVNVRAVAYPRDIAGRASSIEAELGRQPDSGAILAELLAELCVRVDQLAAGDSNPVLERWRALAPSASGTAVEWDGVDGRSAGISAGIADDGALLVRTGDRVERVIAGELRWGGRDRSCC
jgi:BirA family biotin operon repressor/biotin-[acetyl-CoA-carboxylase] ligase